MTTTKALAKLYKTITGSEARNSIGRILSDLADNWSTAVPGAGLEPAANVAKAAGTAPTKAEFDALIDALVAAGLMESAS